MRNIQTYDSLCDMARGTIHYKDITGVLRGVKQVTSDARVTVERVKNRFLEPSESGWADFMVNLTFSGSEKEHIFELQLSHDTMIFQRKKLGGHEMYAERRTALELAKLNGWL